MEPEKYPTNGAVRFRIILRRMRSSFQPPRNTEAEIPLVLWSPRQCVTKSGVGKVAGADVKRELHNALVAHTRQLANGGSRGIIVREVQRLARASIG